MSEKSEETKEKSEESEKKSADTEKKLEASAENTESAQEQSSRPKAKPAELKQEPEEAKEKPLEKMTVKDLRDMAKEMPQITGVHGMKKDALIVEIKKVKGIKEEPVKKADSSMGELKQKIKALKVERQAALEAKDKKKATIYKRRISRLKKKTRRAAA